jgi:hypothetical protein
MNHRPKKLLDQACTEACPELVEGLVEGLVESMRGGILCKCFDKTKDNQKRT